MGAACAQDMYRLRNNTSARSLASRRGTILSLKVRRVSALQLGVRHHVKETIMAGMNMQQMMKQARKMQEQLAQAQESMKDVTIDASAGGGMVKATVNGDLELVSIQIDPDALDPEDVDLLQDYDRRRRQRGHPRASARSPASR